MNPSERRLAIAAALCAALWLLPGLGRLDLWAPDEPRFARIADELRALPRGAESLVLLRLGDEPYAQKPPLYYWLAAALGAPGGRVDEWAARLPSAAAGVALAATTALLAKRMFPLAPSAAPWAVVVLLTAFRFTWTARRAQLDVLLALFETLAIAAVACPRSSSSSPAAPTDGDDATNGRWLCFALAAGLLLKGPVALLVLPILALWYWWEGRPVPWQRALSLRALGLTLGPVLAWLCAAVVLAPAGFFDQLVVENLLDRFFAGSSHARPVWYYLRQAPLDFLPWSPVALLGLIGLWRVARDGETAQRGPARLILAWVAVPLVFFSLSAGKRGLYLLPIYPALALASGVWLDRVLRTPGRRRVAIGAAAAWAVALAVFLHAVLPGYDATKSPRRVVAAAEEAARGRPVGLYQQAPTWPGLLHYAAAGPVQRIADPAEAQRFFRSGGGALVLRSRQLGEVDPDGQLGVAARLREGRRELLVAAPRPGSETPTTR